VIGKVLDGSSLSAMVGGQSSAAAWLTTARALSAPLYLPALAVQEVRTVRPDVGGELAELLGHPSVVLADADAVLARRIEEVLGERSVFDGLAGHVVVVARSRGWPVLTADPGRLRRLDPEVVVDLL
jgi:predicted nucleic acid-binding protein